MVEEMSYYISMMLYAKVRVVIESDRGVNEAVENIVCLEPARGPHAASGPHSCPE